MRPRPARIAAVALGVAALALAAAGAGAQELPAVPLGVRDAVKLALEKNLDLSIERLSPFIARQQEREASGAFDPILGAGVTYARTERFENNLLETSARSGIIQERTLTLDYPSLFGRLPTGTQYNLGLTTPIIDSNNPLRLYNESYQPVLTFGVTQPLWRDFGIEVNTVKIRQAQKAQAQNVHAVEAKMLAVIRDVETRYWSAFSAEERVRTARGSLGLATDLVERLTRARDAGLATALDVLEAQSAVAARRSELARAESDRIAAQSQLRFLVDPRPGVFAPIAITGRPPDEGPPADLESRINRGLVARPEIRQQELAIDRLALEERLAQNSAQWRLDAIGSLGWNGLSGTGVNPSFTGSLPSRLQGQNSYPDSFRNFLSPDGNVSYAVGLRLQIPVGNNEALGRLGQVRLVRRQEELRLKLLQSQVGVEVETAFGEMTAQAVRLAGARDAARIAREQLDARERGSSAGLATVRQVLEAQDALARAVDTLNQAWADYASARARLDAAQGQSLDTYNLTVER